MSALRNAVRELRQKAGLQQQDLAARVGVSRQALGAIEAGETIPSTALALALAAALECRVEELFSLVDDAGPLTAVLAGARPPARKGARVAVAQVQGAWMAHALDGDDPAASTTPADGLVARLDRDGRRATVEPLRDVEALRANLLVAGCDPALGLLAGHLQEQGRRVRLHWREAGSEAALAALERGEVHAAGLHLFDEASGEYNVAAVRGLGAARPLLLVNLAVWEQGLVTAPGNPRRLRRASDLVSRGARVALREPGSGARALLERSLAAAGLAVSKLVVAATVRGHHAVARAVASGAADAGVASRAAAVAFDLDFVPWAEDRFDLVMSAETARTASGQRLLEALASARFRKDAGALPGYGTARTGKVVAEVAA